MFISSMQVVHCGVRARGGAGDSELGVGRASSFSKFDIGMVSFRSMVRVSAAKLAVLHLGLRLRRSEGTGVGMLDRQYSVDRR
jgi:hypothetical protein